MQARIYFTQTFIALPPRLISKRVFSDAQPQAELEFLIILYISLFFNLIKLLT